MYQLVSALDDLCHVVHTGLCCLAATDPYVHTVVKQGGASPRRLGRALRKSRECMLRHNSDLTPPAGCDGHHLCGYALLDGTRGHGADS
jgi:hypothetical protein